MGEASLSWRKVSHAAASGPWNMGFDEALFARAQLEGREGIPTLRFYAWDGPWLSLGYGQRIGEARRTALARAGVGVVRRVTGGRAVLHGQDLTYALAAPVTALPETLQGSYQLVADALLEALSQLGVPAARSAPGARAPDGSVFDCFAAPAADEICLDGQKIAGSAQRRAGGALLQHGSIRLRPDPPDVVAAVTGGAALGGSSLAEMGHLLSRDLLEQALTQTLGNALGVSFQPERNAPLLEASARLRTADAPVQSGDRSGSRGAPSRASIDLSRS